MIEVKDLHKALGGKEVLRGVNLEVPEGSTTTILGLSGCGKSTLLKHIIGLLKPDRGSVIVDDRDVARAGRSELEEIRKLFGMVFQGSALLQSLTVAENVALSLVEAGKLNPGEIRETVAHKLSLVKLTGFEGYYPADLSGGMRKRAALARAIVHNPRIILYDEPTTGLDPIITTATNELIVEMREKLGVTSVVISHDIESACQTSDVLAILHGGVIVQSGPPDAVMSTTDPAVRQFLDGRTRGPLTEGWEGEAE